MRVAIVTESFLPQVNGVTNTVRHVVRHLVRTGHQPLVIAPGPGESDHEGVPVHRARSVRLPGYRSFPLGLPDAEVRRVLSDFGPDVVHLASPIALGAVGLRAARRLDLPTVAVYQTDVGGFARHYGVPADALLDRWVARVHRRADRTLVPSEAARRQLAAWGVDDLHLWRRGVSFDLFGPERRDPGLHARWSGGGRDVVVGYVGRLAAEKQVRRLVELGDLPGVRLVVVGDGPERAWLERRLPSAVFTGFLEGERLATAFASLDVFVHLGTDETFCQTVQEAQASGVAVVAPNAGGPVDLVEPGHSGLLHDVDDPASLRRRVATLAAEPLARQGLALGGRGAVAGRTWSRLVAELVEVHYASVVDRRLPGGAGLAA
jgi:phosphatidylinositol alpha 1,6-mannosyltransferase